MEFLLLASLFVVSVVYSVFTFLKAIVSRMRDRCCYIMAFECYKGTKERTLDLDASGALIMRNKNLGAEEYKFLLRMMVSSGLGEETYGPRNIIEGREDTATLADCHSDIDDMAFGTLDSLFAKSGVSSSEIDMLVVAISSFTSAPSVASRIINRYGMRDDIKSFNLSGMGCSGSIAAVDLVQQLFRIHKNSTAVVFSSESLAPNWYCGKEKSMMLPNTLFRSGASSVLLTNKASLRHQAMLKLRHSVRVHIGASDDAYHSCQQMEDQQGYKGVFLTKDVPKSAARAFTENMTVLVPKILPLHELVRYMMVSYRASKGKKTLTAGGLNLKTGIDHFCIHPGGKAVIDGMGKSLGLNEHDLEPVRMTVQRFGNTSAAGIWYVLAYMEAKRRLKKGDRILMIGLGSGFKCCNCVWEVMKDLDGANVWQDCIQGYPLQSFVSPFIKKFSWVNEMAHQAQP